MRFLPLFLLQAIACGANDGMFVAHLVETNEPIEFRWDDSECSLFNQGQHTDCSGLTARIGGRTGLGALLYANDPTGEGLNIQGRFDDSNDRFSIMMFRPWDRRTVDLEVVAADRTRTTERIFLHEMDPWPDTWKPMAVIGDATHDGLFDSADLVQVFQAGQYEDNRQLNSTWETGDWNGDSEFDSSDLVLAYQHHQPATAVVPEPSSVVLTSSLFLLSLFYRRTSR